MHLYKCARPLKEVCEVPSPPYFKLLRCCMESLYILSAYQRGKKIKNSTELLQIPNNSSIATNDNNLTGFLAEK